MVLSELVEFGPCVSAETVKACALIGLRTMAEENALRSNSDSSLDLGMAAQTALCAAEWAGSEDASSLEYYEHNVGNLAIEVVGQNYWSSEVISLFSEDWDIGRVASSCHACQWNLSCQEMRDACGVSSESLGPPRSLSSECLEGNEGEGT